MDSDKPLENDPSAAPPGEDEGDAAPPSEDPEAVPPAPAEDSAIEKGGEESLEEGEEEPLGAEADEEAIGACTRRLRIRVQAERVQRQLDKTYEELRKSAQVRGFRPGKVPRRYLERRFGPEIESELRQELLQRAFREVMEERDWTVLGMTEFKEIEFSPGKPFQCVVDVDIFPTFEPPTYEGLELPREELRVTDEEVEAELGRLRETAVSLVPPPEGDDSILPSDRLVVNYRLLDGDRERFRRRRVQAIPELNAIDGIAVEGLAEGLKDRTAPKRFKAKPPANFRDGHLAGREVEIEVEVLDVRRVHVPELEQELPQYFGCQGLGDLRDQVRAALSAQKRRELDRAFEERIVDILVEKADIPLPENLVEDEARRNAEGEEEPTPDLLARAREELKRRFLLIAIARKEGIEVSDDEVRARLGEFEEKLGRPAGTLVKGLEWTADFERLREALLLEKTRERLRRLNEAIGAEGASSPPAPGTPPEAPTGPGAEGERAPEGAGGEA